MSCLKEDEEVQQAISCRKDWKVVLYDLEVVLLTSLMKVKEAKLENIL